MSDKGVGKYNVVVIGAGTAGLVTAAGTVGLGGRAALIERNKMGGDCLNFGCVPSKALIASARQAHAVRRAHRFGLGRLEPVIDFQAVFERMRARRARIEPNDSAARFESLGVDVFSGEARFVSPHEVQVGDRTLRARNFVIATGCRAALPPVEGLADVPYHTNETIFDELHEKPERLAVIGGGPIGCELGQTFQRLGVEVTLIEVADRLLAREDPDVSEVLRERLVAEGVDVRVGVLVRSARKGNGAIELAVAASDAERTETVRVDEVLVAAGRTPNVESLGLEAAGVAFGRRGVEVNEHLQTSQPHIYAAGDVVGPYQFTHVADMHARVVVRNILLPIKKVRVDYRVVPWCTYTDPEVARVGLNETDAKQQGVACDVWTQPLAEVDRAIVSDEDTGFVKVLTARGKDRILGATLVCAHAGELLHEFVVAMKHGIGLGKLSGTIHAYPTLAEMARKLGDQYQRTRLTPTARKVFSWIYRRARA